MRFQSQKKKSLKTHQLDFQEFDTPVLCLFHCLEGTFAYLHKELHVNSEATISEQHISVYEFFKKKEKKKNTNVVITHRHGLRHSFHQL